MGTGSVATSLLATRGGEEEGVRRVVGGETLFFLRVGSLTGDSAFAAPSAGGAVPTREGGLAEV
jgi:hypothetical protein